MIGLCIQSSIVPSSAWIGRTDLRSTHPSQRDGSAPHRQPTEHFDRGLHSWSRIRRSTGGGVDHYRVGQPVRHVSGGIWDRYVPLFISVGGPSQGSQYSNHWLAHEPRAKPPERGDQAQLEMSRSRSSRLRVISVES